MSLLKSFVLLSAVALSVGITVKVEPRSEECIQEEIKDHGVPITMIFQVTAGGELDIDCTITDQRGNIIQSYKGQQDGRHHWTSVGSGSYKICFGNHMARWTPKWVSFYISVGNSPNTARLEHLDPIEQTIIQLSQGLTELQDEQKLLRAVERLHRDTIDTTNTRILYWSIFEAIVLVTMGLFQIYYLKRFLEVKSSI
eukprot:TRINITY_DN31127_c0_g1_i1.p1 TRINITY_DN31127_c0_g1~~TRINITY_DN31127_c0_g1_i1.p1  ORF type:complete len:198 (+),score=21.32 TRINITY_DN31127_c0_g1_i1:43-636(+)